ncbi:hypothetical protein K501DRAFT_203041, partial [Backusella circina FSU 941]
AVIQELIESCGYKTVFLPPYSLFLNPIELFWSKLKAGVKRDFLTTTDKCERLSRMDQALDFIF